MRYSTVRFLVAVILLIPSMCTSVRENKSREKIIYDSGVNYNWEKNMVIADRIRDDAGMLLPLQSYEETILRGMFFLLHDHMSWFKGPDESLEDEQGQIQMPWVYYSNLQHNGAPFPASIDRFVSYPAFHHSLMIRAFLKYWDYSGDKQALEEAIKLSDWNIAHSTPDYWAYGKMPYSTFEEKKPGGFRDKSGIMPDKGAMMALAYLELYGATDEPRFLKAAEAIGQSLARNQKANGTWPFRVDPETEEVIEDYTSSVIYAVLLFEELDELNHNDFYKSYRDRTWKWLLNGPVKTKEFRGFYEDIPESKEGRTNYDCLDVIRYLLDNRSGSNGYLEMALELNAWVEEVFMDPIEGFEPAEGIREQLQCNYIMGIHSLNWASMLKELAEASNNEIMMERAIQTANYVTYYLQPDNRIVVGFEYPQWWYSCHIGVILYLMDFKTTAIDENQVKAWSAPFRNWHYYPDHVIPASPGLDGYEDIHMTDVPTVFQLPGSNKWYMSFIGFDGQGYQSFIAESEDLVHWDHMKLAMGYGPEGEFDYGGVVLGAYLYEDYDIRAPRTLKKKDGKFVSLYGAYPRQGGYELRPGYEGLASSVDGLNWQRAMDEPILSVYQEDCGEWEKDCIYQPWLLEHEGKYYNLYNAANGHIEQLGLASSENLVDWKRFAGNPVISVGPEGSYNEKFSSDIKVFWDKDHWVGFFFGVGKEGAHIMVAYSYDLVSWTIDPDPLYKAGGNPSGLDALYAHKISLVWNPDNACYYMFYCAVDKDQNRGIGLITSKPL